MLTKGNQREFRNKFTMQYRSNYVFIEKIMGGNKQRGRSDPALNWQRPAVPAEMERWTISSDIFFGILMYFSPHC